MFATSITASPLGLFLAFIGGVVSILSPCVLPILPGLFSMVSGMTIQELKEDKNLGKRVLVLCALFSAGFTAVYIVIGLTTTEISRSFFDNSITATRVGGFVIIFLSLFLLLGHFTKYRFFMAEKRPFFVNGVTDSGAFVTGAAFGFGWSPCFGPILAGVIAYASTESAIIPRVSLILMYCLGLCIALTFVVYSAFRFDKVTNFLKKNMNSFVWISFAVMFFFGVILATNQMAFITSNLVNFLDFIGLDSLVTIG